MLSQVMNPLGRSSSRFGICLSRGEYKIIDHYMVKPISTALNSSEMTVGCRLINGRFGLPCPRYSSSCASESYSRKFIGVLRKPISFEASLELIAINLLANKCLILLKRRCELVSTATSSHKYLRLPQECGLAVSVFRRWWREQRRHLRKTETARPHHTSQTTTLARRNAEHANMIPTRLTQIISSAAQCQTPHVQLLWCPVYGADVSTSDTVFFGSISAS